MEFLNIASTFGAFTFHWNKFCAKKYKTKLKKKMKNENFRNKISHSRCFFFIRFSCIFFASILINFFHLILPRIFFFCMGTLVRPSVMGLVHTETLNSSARCFFCSLPWKKKTLNEEFIVHFTVVVNL